MINTTPLQNKKNLLAFSAGTDSSALFFILLSANIPFDLAFVNYQTRASSDEEEGYAHTLARQYNKQLFVKTIKLDASNFEHEARGVRYMFFEEIVRLHGYDNLITAHQLNDRFEWFLMQLSRGAGLGELLGFEEVQKRDFYTLCRPFIHTPKNIILDYLQTHKIHHYVDASNADTHHRRNYFRTHFSNLFVEQFHEGLIKSYAYLQNDFALLEVPKVVEQHHQYYKIEQKSNDNLNIKTIDTILKKLGVLASKASKDEIIRTKDCVVNRAIAVVFDGGHIHIAPYIQTPMEKKYKERFRRMKIPSKIRGYLYSLNEISPED